MADLFVSYASPDLDAATTIVQTLERNGISCWIAPRNIPPGEDYGDAIVTAIAACRALLLVLSEHANESIFVHREVERAVSRSKPVLPVRIREVTPTGALELFVSSAQWIDAWQPPLEQQLLPLVDAVTRLTAPAPGPGPAPAPPPAPAPEMVPPPPAGSQSGRPVAAVPRGARPAPVGRRWRLAAAGALLLAASALLLTWAPWQPAWRRDGARFLAGAWCLTTESGSSVRTDFVRTGGDRLQGTVSYSHSTATDRFTVLATPTGDGLELTWTAVGEPGTALTRYRVLDGRTLLTVFADGQPADGPPLVRCGG